MKNKDNKDNQLERQQRLQAILHSAFAGPPTPLKDIPKRNGESRAEKPAKVQRRKRQRKNRAA